MQLNFTRKASVWAIGAFLVAIQSLCGAVTISSLSANTSSVGRYQKYELTFNLAGVSPSNYNPFRPETSGDSLSPAGVNVRAEVVTPSGSVQTVPGFYDVDLEYLGDSRKFPGRDRIVPISAPHWHIRYAPKELGTYKITVKATDTSDTATSSQLSFTCVESGSKGFVRISSDGSRFVYSDGSPFVPFGTMLPYGTQKIAPVTASMKANGMNFIRKWLVNRDKDDIHREMESWSSYSSDTSTYRSGSRSATKSVSGTGSIVDQSFIGCKPNTYYKASAYIKTSSSFNGQAAVYVSEDGYNVSTANRIGNQIGSNQNWALSQVIFKTGSNAELLHFKPRVLSGSSGTVWVDDVGLYECDASGNIIVNYNMVFNPGFEKWNPSQLRMIPLARLEYLLKMCEANGIVVQPTVFDYRLWNASNPTGFYSNFYGDWWTDPASIAQQDRVLRYLVARFGAYRSLFGWELTNEMDSSYTDVRDTWIAGRSKYIKANDPRQHPVTNSYWKSPADYEYIQMPEIDVGQVHYYINTEERSGGQGYPSWWTLPSGMTIDTSSANAASGSRSLKATANGSTISDSATIDCKPSRSYTMQYKVKTSGVSGEASVIIQPYGGSSAGGLISVKETGSIGYTSRTRTFTTGSTAVGFILKLQLTGSSGTAWWDDISVIDNTTGRPMLYNGGFESPPFGDDEYEWGFYNTFRTWQCYETGTGGVRKPWVSGEFGLMGLDADISLWAKYGDTTKPRHDTTGIHVHNCVWSQLVASSALNTPTYWWMDEYILPYDLYGVWKGATTFAANLPFYDHGTLVATDPYAEVRATSSNARIRLMGQKKSDSGYFWIQNSQYSWSRVVRDGLSPTATSAALTIPGFEDGEYTVKWYDTSTGQLALTESKTVSGGNLTLSVSSLSKDTAVTVSKGSGGSTTQPQVELSLSASKTNASPSETITYTLTYTNKGSGNAVNVEITLPIPANTAFVAGSASNGGIYSSATNSVKWTAPSLAPGASGQVTAGVKVN